MAATRLWLVLPVILMATSCQTDGGKPPAISLEEARQVVATFEGQSFVPPPKTIDDITDGGKPPAISLEEARQVVATFEGQSFVPPPKTRFSTNKRSPIPNRSNAPAPKLIRRARLGSTERNWRNS